MKNRLQIITSMCYTFRHDYGLRKGGAMPHSSLYQGGMTDEEAKALWDQMAQIFDNDIAPYMEFKNGQ
jgi:nicotinic acid phosphoribosyltransferase